MLDLCRPVRMTNPTTPICRAENGFTRFVSVWLSAAVVACSLLSGGGIVIGAEGPDEIDFNRDIRPILSNHCLACHGPDEGQREAGLRLDVREAALARLESDLRAIVPGQPDASELIRRIESSGEFERMPPPDFAKPLSNRQKELLRRWIAEGADYAVHWAFVPPVRPTPPSIEAAARSLRKADNDAAESAGIFSDWSRHPIDAFVLDRLSREGLRPSPQAKPETLIRRLSLDLTGLPPTPEEVEAFVSSPSESAYGNAVERLLASQHFGERMAMFWLDAARYADTDGFQQDATRTNWPWRDWVIEAFNCNMPFDQFTLEQFAGDLLPNATPEQKLATCFHRNHMTNGEGGRDPEESRIDYVIDRVNTMGTVWLGLTLGCCQCHSHKFDPIQQAEYYQLSAFFNSIDEDGRAGRGAKPFLKWESSTADQAVHEAERWLEQQQARADEVRQAAEPRFQEWLGRRIEAVRGGFQAWVPLTASQLESRAGTDLVQLDDGTIQAGGPNPHHEDYHIIAAAPSLARQGVRLQRITGLKLEVLPHPSHTQGGLSRSDAGHFILSDLKLRVRSTSHAEVRDVKIAEARADYSADPGKNGGYGDVRHTLDDDPRNGWASFGADLHEPRIAVFRLEEPLLLDPDEQLVVELQQRALQGRHNLGRFRVSVTDQAGETPSSLGRAPLEDLAGLGAADVRRVGGKLRQRLFDQFLADDPEFLAAQEAVERARSQVQEFRAAAGTLNVMVLAERAEPRPTHVLVRGVWNAKGQEVGRGVPSAVAGWPQDAPLDRIGLARWLTNRNNPLTARVMVNHIWGLLFGAGLVRTPGDFGIQGERPTHPKLLDWLAVEFMDSGWDVKHIVRLIVASATYRQSSNVGEALLRRDPDNRLLARGARFRMPSWMIRDVALKAAGLLNPAVGGPPVRPYQPPGVWADITMGRFHYEPSVGPARYRRTVYAFWRRSAAPTFLFDSAQRRVCEVRTDRTNTPLHALTLLNDLTGLEAARALARHAMQVEESPEACFQVIAMRVLSRRLADQEIAVLKQKFERGVAYYQTHPSDGRRFLSLGRPPLDPKQAPADLAAMMVVASMVLNLDEAITRE